MQLSTHVLLLGLFFFMSLGSVIQLSTHVLLLGLLFKS